MKSIKKFLPIPIIILAIIIIIMIVGSITSNIKISPASQLAQIYGDGSGLVGWYEFTSGSVADSSGNSNDGTSSGPTSTTGQIGEALSFDGSDDYVSVPLNLNSLSAVSVSAWVKSSTADISANTGIFSNFQLTDSLELGVSSAEKFYFWAYNDSGGQASATADSASTVTSWHHIVGVFDGTNVYIYVDGSSVDSSPGSLSSNTRSNGGTTYKVGSGGQVAAPTYFPGVIDDVMVYNRALTSSEISVIYNDGLAGGFSDNTGPTVSITAPSDNDTVSGDSVTVSADASDDTSVSSVQFKLDGSDLQSADTSSPYSITWDTTGASDSSHTLTAVAVDIYGNSTTSSSISVTVDNGVGDVTAPVLSSGSPSGSLDAGTTSTTLSVTTDENATCKYGTTADTAYASIANTFTTTGSTSHSESISGLTDNTSYNYYIRCEDSTGNANSSDYTVSFSVSAGAGPTTYYVDQDNPSADDSNPGTEALPFSTIQAAADIVDPGDTVLIKAGTYQNQLSYCVGATCNLVSISRPGTSGNVITFRPYQSDTVILRGFGFEDQDLNSDGLADGVAQSGKSETLVKISGDYINISDLELTNSQGSGMSITGSYNTVERMIVDNNWSNGISIGDAGLEQVEYNTVQDCELYNNRYYTGIFIQMRSSVAVDGTGDRYLVTKNLIKDNLSYKNGYLPNGTKVLPIGGDPAGGGNADGFESSKYCGQGPEYNSDISVSNLCPNNVLRGNVAWQNADDGFDMSFADSLLEDNISFDNGPEGRQGFKVFLSYVENNLFVGNIAYRNDEDGFQPRSGGGDLMLNNLAVGNGDKGFEGAGNQFKNNIGYDNTSSDINSSSCPDCSNNISGDGSFGTTGDPGLADSTPFQDEEGTITVTFPEGLTIAQKVAWIKDQFSTAFTPVSSSIAIDAGVAVSYTDPITGDTTNRSYYGDAPDIGAYEYDPSDGDTTPPTITSVTSSTSDDTYTADDTINITVNFSEAVTSTGSVTVTLDSGGSCSFTVSNSSTGSCTYTVGAGEDSSDLTTTDISGTIADQADNAMSNFTPATNLAASSAIVIDTTAPVRSAGSPSGTQAFGTTSVSLSLTTAENATCKYSTSSGTAYGSMTAFTTTGTTSHAITVSGLTSGGSYTYYIRCADASNNTNTSDYNISFSVSTGTSSNGSTTNGSSRIGNILPQTSTSQPSLNITRNLKSGDSGIDVASLQHFLNTNLDLNLIEDGKLGPNTVNAIKKWQEEHGLTPDGIVGPNTRNSMNNLSSVSSNYNLGNTTLRDGSTGGSVKELQRFLNDKLNLNLNVDGLFGPQTTNAIKIWQTSQGLIPDGIVGPRTREKINAVLTN